MQLLTEEMIKKEEEEAKTTTTTATTTTTTESQYGGGDESSSVTSTTVKDSPYKDEMYSTFLDDAENVQLRWKYDDMKITLEVRTL